ncbi:MAG: hypothetical protein JW910_05355 [Anaerolineae bacterium]|nr:hypothetical protein [Anaerolineae bacterium]
MKDEKEPEAVQAAADDIGVVFDLSQVTVLEWAEYVEMSNDSTLALTTKAKRQAAFFAKHMKSCPAAWGDPHDPNTYLSRPYFTEFEPIVVALWREVDELRKKAQKPSATS